MDIDRLIDRAFDFELATGEKIRSVPVTVKAGIGAACYYAVADRVRIDPPGECDTEAVIFCDICHEYAHAYQRKQMGLAKYLLYKTFRRSEIEREPERIGLRACEWYNENVR